MRSYVVQRDRLFNPRRRLRVSALHIPMVPCAYGSFRMLLRSLRGAALSILLFTIAHLDAGVAETVPLVPVKLPGRFGYIDRTGQWVIQPRFEEAFDFHRSVARVRSGGKFGYIDKTGGFVIAPQYDEIGSYSEGLLRVRVGDRVGYLNSEHAIAIPPQFEDAADFAGGLARVKVNGRWGFINPAGQVVVAPQFDALHDFSESLARAIVAGKAGYIDPTGRVAIPLQFTIDNYDYGADDFHDGLALVAFRKGQGWRIGYLNPEGKFAIEPALTDAYAFSEGLAVAQRSVFKLRFRGWAALYGYMDASGKMVIAPQFVERPNHFSDGLAMIRVDNKSGYIDRTGRVVLPPTYYEGTDFRFGLALVRGSDPLHVYIDKSGAVVSDGIALYNYEGWVGDYPTRKFPDGLERMRVRAGAHVRYGFRDETGVVRIAPRYEFALPFSEGLARVRLEDGSYACIDRRGEVVHSEPGSGPELAEEMQRVRTTQDTRPYVLEDATDTVLSGSYQYLGVFSGGLARVRRAETAMGYADATGTVVIDGRFDEAMAFDDGVARVRYDGRWGLIDGTSEYLAPPQFDAIRPFSEGLAAVSTGSYPELKWGYIDRRGRAAVAPQFDEAADFSEGLAKARINTRGTGFIDRAGAWVVQPQFYETRSFHGGRAAVQVLISEYQVGKWGYIDSKGAFATAPRFDEAHDLTDGLAAVRLGDKWGYVDANGQMAIEPRFATADDFSGGHASVSLSGSRVIIDREGKVTGDAVGDGR